MARAAARARAARPALHLLVLLLAVAARWSAAQGDQPAPQLLTSQPNCQVESSVPGILPAGITPVPEARGGMIAAGGQGGCTVVLPQLAPGETQLYQFGVLPAADMSLVVVLRAIGGSARLDLFLPSEGGDAGGEPDVAGAVSRDSAASSEAWLSVPAARLADNPGLYTLRLRGESGSPTVEVVVSTPGSDLLLEAGEAAALAGLAKDCCAAAGAKSAFCGTTAPAAFAPGHPWTSDLCHTPPNLCDAKGRLLSLELRDAGLRCPAFPRGLAALSALHRLDLSGNEIKGDVADAAEVLAEMPLSELYLANTRLGGTLDCRIVAPGRRVIDLSSNFISGRVEPCMLTAPVEHLYLSRNELTGSLPAGAYKGSTLQALALASQRQPKGGITGSIPEGLLALPTLLFVNLANNKLGGRLAGFPPNAVAFNASANNLEGGLPPLPESLWVVDLTANNLSGPLPPLAALPRLEGLLLGGNALEGSLPPLPPALAMLDASYNRLSGPLPALPPPLSVLDLSSNLGLSGDIGGLNVSGLAELRLGNNSFTGGVPASATQSKTLTMLSLRANKLGGAIPGDWDVPLLEMLLLNDNGFTGSIPVSLARQPRLGTLRLEGNRLGGSLEAFAAALPPGPGGDGDDDAPRSHIFHFDASRNALGGALPDELQRLGVFASDQHYVMAAPSGQVSFQRILDVSDNRLDSGWPGWLLSAVPQALTTCHCSVNVRLGGPDMRLACPRSAANVTDYYWQVASQSGFTCWDGVRAVPLTDYLSSPNNEVDPADVDGPIFGDSPPAPPKLTPGGAAGVVIGVVVGALALAGAAYFLGYQRLWREHKAGRFTRFQGGGGGGRQPGSTHADAAAVAAAVEGLSPPRRG
ncbi:MAG: hypothetical protein J3K34DRAFT_409783 [Monoraphidium minutum]|nr:MAG: hypothetical protein J3K34DRAFT_409783 [Monoraphidium minutum]